MNQKTSKAFKADCFLLNTICAISEQQHFVSECYFHSHSNFSKGPSSLNSDKLCRK